MRIPISFACLLLFATTALPLTAVAKDGIVVDLVSEPSSLDPQKQWNPDSYFVYRNIFDQLVTRDDDGKITPSIATAWNYKSDTDIAFTLRSDVTFQDGTRLTPEDVAFSVNRIIDRKFASPQLSQFNKIVSATVTGPNEVTLKTDGPYPVLLAQLVKLSIVPKHVIEAVGNDAFNLQPVGSGPYSFGAWQRGVAVSLVRNDSYWGKKGYFKTAEFRAVPDASTRVANLKAGTADLAVTLNPDLAAQIDPSSGAKVLTAVTERIAYLKLNPSRPPFDDANLRRAVAYAVDRSSLIEGLLGGFDKPVSQLASPEYAGYVDGIVGLSFDTDKAKALVEKAGEKAKQPIAFLTSPTFDQRIVEALVQQLGDVGFNVNIETVDFATYLQRIQSDKPKQPAISFGRWSCACQDADGISFPLLHSSSSFSALSNPQIDAWLTEARNTLDASKRIDAYRHVATSVASDVPVLPLYQAAVLYGASAKLNWQPTANESFFLNRASWRD
ncbi:ABC transporter substrate-binding protein [Rhizobium tumorigenes]|uniref:ABC transporter substrate-binding protein n=1 Tax=Rhizobium tumorigenes TaxID=2041385 RepID=A0AAF1KQJ8_9HYPH|nr:ABC transporter substrate-binding protein [Rhizobium tumorigenes]WFR97860.1 ABC transporter substrate-binding protein [Rhizobium tumorigenes]WFS03419.1 ABC transporter substrate-binding protein [Rhizobium tumorigenes]